MSAMGYDSDRPRRVVDDRNDFGHVYPRERDGNSSSTPSTGSHRTLRRSSNSIHRPPTAPPLSNATTHPTAHRNNTDPIPLPPKSKASAASASTRSLTHSLKVETAANRALVEHLHLLQSHIDQQVLRERALQAELGAMRRERDRARHQTESYARELEVAQRELARGEALCASTDAARAEAEEDAARARDAARRWESEVRVREAREEGRRAGYQRGLEDGERLRRVGGHVVLEGQIPMAMDEDADDAEDEEVVFGRRAPPARAQSARPPSRSTSHTRRAGPPPTSAPPTSGPTQRYPIPISRSEPLSSPENITVRPIPRRPDPPPPPPPRSQTPGPPRSRTPGGHSRSRSYSISAPLPPLPRQHTRTPSTTHAHSPAPPPDNWIPLAHKDSGIFDVPPPHEMLPPSPRMPSDDLPRPGHSGTDPYAGDAAASATAFPRMGGNRSANPYGGDDQQERGRTYTRGRAGSAASTHLSEMEIISPPRTLTQTPHSHARAQTPHAQTRAHTPHAPPPQMAHMRSASMPLVPQVQDDVFSSNGGYPSAGYGGGNPGYSYGGGRGDGGGEGSSSTRDSTSERIRDAWRAANPGAEADSRPASRNEGPSGRHRSSRSRNASASRRPREVEVQPPQQQPQMNAQAPPPPPRNGPRQSQVRGKQLRGKGPLDYLRRPFHRRAASSGAVDIQVQPPSQSPSTVSPATTAAPQDNMLSPDMIPLSLPPAPSVNVLNQQFVKGFRGPREDDPDYFSYNVDADPMRKETPPYPDVAQRMATPASQGRRGAPGVQQSPAPLNRPISIFSEED